MFGVFPVRNEIIFLVIPYILTWNGAKILTFIQGDAINILNRFRDAIANSSQDSFSLCSFETSRTNIDSLDFN